MFSNMLNQKKYVSKEQNFRRTIPLNIDFSFSSTTSAFVSP